MKNLRWNLRWARTLVPLIATTASIETNADTVVITTRKQVDTAYGTDRAEMKGPGMTTPGDVAMGILLGHHGYSSRLVIDALLASANPVNERDALLQPGDPNLKVGLVIVSGSSSSADVPEPPVGIPMMMGEHVTLGNNSGRPGSIYMYNGVASNDPNESQNATKFMKVLRPDHPIMAGIPLDAQQRVKIFREPYPSEEARVPAGGFRNYEYRWCTQNAPDAAAGTKVLGVLDTDESRACFAVVEAGEMLASGTSATARMVHFFANENGSGGSRRVFLALTDIAQTIFVRAAKWAMNESLTPYKAVEITKVQGAGPGNLEVSWKATANSNYTLEASADFLDWQIVVEDITGVDGTLTHTVRANPVFKDLFLRVAAAP